MKVPENILKEWKYLKDNGDVQRLVEATGYSQPTITLAFKGEASEELINAISKFFIDKKERLDAVRSGLVK